eukprot:1150049-Pelagomonas_calceolata.AAC.1
MYPLHKEVEKSNGDQEGYEQYPVPDLVDKNVTVTEALEVAVAGGECSLLPRAPIYFSTDTGNRSFKLTLFSRATRSKEGTRACYL